MHNAAREIVVGMPTEQKQIELSDGKTYGYETVFTVYSAEMLEKALLEVKNCNNLTFVEVKCAIKLRKDLSSSTIKSIDSKMNFMEYIMAQYYCYL